MRKNHSYISLLISILCKLQWIFYVDQLHLFYINLPHGPPKDHCAPQFITICLWTPKNITLTPKLFLFQVYCLLLIYISSYLHIYLYEILIIINSLLKVLVYQWIFFIWISEVSRKMTTLTEVNVEAATQTESNS